MSETDAFDPTVDYPAIINAAFTGERGDDQRRIAQVGMAWVETLLRKNLDYGSSVWTQPVLAPDANVDAAIRVRMSDKVQRIQSLIGRANEVNGESLEDSVSDLGAYCLLWLARPKETP